MENTCSELIRVIRCSGSSLLKMIFGLEGEELFKDEIEFLGSIFQPKLKCLLSEDRCGQSPKNVCLRSRRRLLRTKPQLRRKNGTLSDRKAYKLRSQ